MVKISKGNSKVGNIPNISLTPIESCSNCEGCKLDCYALKAYRQYPTTRAAWDGNFAQYKTDPDAYFEGVERFIATKKPRFFRWHVAGDIQGQAYLDQMRAIAADHPETKFLAFPKVYSLNFADLPDNLTIVLSAWPGMELSNPYGLPVAFMQDGTETRAEGSLECPGNCESCGMCWALKTIKQNEVFHKHSASIKAQAWPKRHAYFLALNRARIDARRESGRGYYAV